MKRESVTTRGGGPDATGAQRLVPLREVLIDTRAELWDVVIHTGLQVIEALLEEDREQLCGPWYVHDGQRTASRAGKVSSAVVLGGRKVPIRRPRVRGPAGEVALPTCHALAAVDPLTRRAVEQMVLGVSTRRYSRSLEPLPPPLRSRSTSKSAVSRRFVARTRAQLEAWHTRPLEALDLAVLFIDGCSSRGTAWWWPWASTPVGRSTCWACGIHREHRGLSGLVGEFA